MTAALIQAAAAVTAAGVIWRVVIRPIWRTHRAVLRAVGQVELIVSELGSNGGASVRDAVDRIEAAVLFQDLRARALINDAAHGYVETDERGGLIFANRTYLHWAGRSMDEVTGEGWVNIFTEEDRDRVVREWRRTVDHDRDLTLAFDIQHLRTKQVTPVVAHCYAIRGRAVQKTLGWACVLHEDGVNG